MNFIYVTGVEANHTMIIESQHCRFKSGDKVKFAGVTGHLSRIAVQQCMSAEIEGSCLIATVYVATAFIQPLNGTKCKYINYSRYAKNVFFDVNV